MSALSTEVKRFKVWADASHPVEQRHGEWECDYNAWGAIYDAFGQFISSRPFELYSVDEVEDILYILARDNEMEHLSEEIRRQCLETLIALARAAIEIGERDARWQLAEQLGHLGRLGGEEEQLLLTLVRDQEEYVRRRALSALARLGSSGVEELALAAWSRPDENQEWARMQALWCLHRIGSRYLEPLLAEAERDGREYLRGFAARVRRGDVDP